MSANPRRYREDLYRLRAHPEAARGEADFIDNRDSFLRVYLSLFPFLTAEYYVERSLDSMPAGLVFPLGFFLFWGFYYTYYKPGFLEDKLSSPGENIIFSIPTLLFGVLIWFVKVTVVELSHLLLLRWVVKKKRAPARRRTAAASAPSPFRPASVAPRSLPQGELKRSVPPIKLPPEVIIALGTLGLPRGADWHTIHQRYRELAKRFHPDLNPDLTDVGSRFMKVDAAYHKLFAVKHRYFPDD